jgi:hypothetical protein
MQSVRRQRKLGAFDNSHDTFCKFFWREIKDDDEFVEMYFPQYAADGGTKRPPPKWPIPLKILRKHGKADYHIIRYWKNATETFKRVAIREIAEFETMEGLPPKRGFPYRWITDNKSIMKNLERKCNRHALELIAFLMRNRMKNAMFDKEPVIVIPDYDKIQETFRITPTAARRYVQELAHRRILEPLVREGERGPKRYAIGRWSQPAGALHPRPLYFLKNTPKMRQRLQRFDSLGKVR